MYVLLVVIHVLISLVLCIVILLQSSKGGGLAGAFGGGGGAPQQILGSRGMTTLLHKITIWCGVGFMITSLALFIFSGSRAASTGSAINRAVQKGEMSSDVTAPPAQTQSPAPAEVPPGGGK